MGGDNGWEERREKREENVREETELGRLSDSAQGFNSVLLPITRIVANQEVATCLQHHSG